MNQNVAPENKLLQSAVRVKKIRFKDLESEKGITKPTRDAIQRQINFQEFRKVYGDNIARNEEKVSSFVAPSVCKTKSGSMVRLPTSTKNPKHIETINIELPVNLGSENAVVPFETKIRPKRSVKKINQEILTESLVEKLMKFEFEKTCKKETPKDTVEQQIKEIEKHIEARKEKISKNAPKLPVKNVKKKHDKIMSALSNINEKLLKMQEKYFTQPRVQYKSVNDCFTQSGNVEVLFENQKYPEGPKIENQKYPEGPKIEDTLMEIENHLDHIVNLNMDQSGSIKKDSSTTYEGFFPIGDISGNTDRHMTSLLESLEQQHHGDSVTTKDILREIEDTKAKRYKAIRQQIATVEDVFERFNEITKDDSDSDSKSSSSTKSEKEEQYLSKYNTEKTKDYKEMNQRIDQYPLLTGSKVLETDIKKSSFLSKEFSKNPSVRVFTENNNAFLRERPKFLNIEDKQSCRSVESVTKLIDSLRFSLDQSLYEPVCPK